MSEQLAHDFIRDFICAAGERDEDDPGFRSPGDTDPDGVDGSLLPVFIEPRDGAPAPGDRKSQENNTNGMLSLFYTGGIETGVLEKFHRKETFDFWIRTSKSQLAKRVDDRLRELLHDKRNWDMAGLMVIESMRWRPMQPIGHGPKGYAFTVSYLFELYAEGGI